VGYARAANASMEAIVDDELDLPVMLPAATQHEGLRRRSAPDAMRVSRQK
jgi:hypothetical protein